MSYIARVFIWIGLAGWIPTVYADAPLRVLTSIKPLQLLAMTVGGDAIAAETLLDPQFSPHDYQLRPSDRLKLGQADVVFWVGPRLEIFLQPLMRTPPSRTTIVSLQDEGQDPHLWLDPIASIEISWRMAQVFSDLSPARTKIFNDNAQRYADAILQQDAEQRAILKQLPKLHGYMVEHDAYGRFESRYGLTHLAALTNAADLPPSAATMLRIERQLSDGSITCVWREPQQSKLLQRLVGGKNLRVVTIDAMAAHIPASQDGALQFYRSLWQEVISCLRI